MRAPVVALLVLALSASTVTSRPLSLPQRTQHFSMCASPHMEVRTAGGTCALRGFGRCASRRRAVSAAEARPSNSPLQVITYSGTSYAMYSRRNWQLLAVQARHPVAFALPGTPAALAAAVVCATRAGLAFRARGGGHSYEGASRVDQGLVIDLERFNRVDVDAADDVAVVGAGQRLGEVYLRLLRAGRVFPAGTCAGNGVSGFLLGGGIGPFTRALGWATGAVVEARGVTAGGKMVVASSTRNPDLFWALRGGGGGHVIVYEASWGSGGAAQARIPPGKGAANKCTRRGSRALPPCSGSSGWRASPSTWPGATRFGTASKAPTRRSGS